MLATTLKRNRKATTACHNPNVAICPAFLLIRCRQILVNVTKCPRTFRCKFNITYVCDYRQLTFKVSPKVLSSTEDKQQYLQCFTQWKFPPEFLEIFCEWYTTNIIEILNVKWNEWSAIIFLKDNHMNGWQ